ncbi:hypothetical protein [Aeromicrobium sp. IC_218]|uniref:hypothetical protein n=1 Tax=Aeromicrobium sp. IC_218 TaxID=2545468 RepID=UPI00103ACAC2|nr:hypothetical protein [Aeromicrobium sp. IC_218]TCI98960.1 hypothetical protein E0W78_09465 [Aeromicrobium sp. IC_218]
MRTERLRAAGLLAAGAVTGGILAATGSATADDTTETPSTSSESTSTEAGRGPGGHGGPGRGLDTAALAKALGVSEDALSTAWEAVREDTKPDGERGSEPSDDEREARQQELAAALAKELDLTEAKVTAALESVREAAAADRRTDLSERLDDAVDEGDLTTRDKASVLKAYDAGVLGRPGR